LIKFILDETKRLAKLVERIKELRLDRDVLLHGEWMPSRNPLFVKVKARKRGVKRTHYISTIPYLETLAVDIGQVTDELEKLPYKYMTSMESIGKWATRR
jgi:hypothetical protein